MPIKPNVKKKEKKALTQRDDVLMVMAFAGAFAMNYFSVGRGELTLPMEWLSYVLGAIGIVILLSMLISNSKKRAHERSQRNHR